MDTDAKIDMLLKLVEGNEKKRVEADERTRAEYQELKKTVESRIPVVEKKVEDLGAVVQELNQKVDRLEGQLRQPKDEQPTTAHDLVHKKPRGMHDSFPQSPNFHSVESAAHFESGGVYGDISGSVPPMICPQFSGDNPQMWKSNCEQYFDVYGIHPNNWVKIATLNFVGNAAFWLQSIRSQLIGITWSGLCELVCNRFTKDRHQALIRQWIRINQSGTVSEYVEKFDGLMHQLMAYDNTMLPDYFITKFVEGLRDDIRIVVMVQRPQDLDSACAIALFQEEAIEGVKFSSYKKSESGVLIKTGRTNQVSTTPLNARGNSNYSEDRRAIEAARARDDKVAVLRAYRRSKGLCFTCGERWGKDHKCSPSIQLHVVEELMEALQGDLGEESEGHDTLENSEDQQGALLSISQ